MMPGKKITTRTGPGKRNAWFWLCSALLAGATGLFSVAVAAPEDTSKPGVDTGGKNQPGGKEAPKTGATASSATTKKAASQDTERVALTTLKPDLTRSKLPAATAREENPVDKALRLIRDCQTSFEKVNDYKCIFYKRERINGQLSPIHVMIMKARTRPMSIYFKFQEPYRGREAIYVQGRNAGKILAHEVGFTRFLTGTLELEPRSAQAMEDNRHPITEAGIGALIDTVATRWASELSPGESVVVFDSNMTIGPRSCTMIESIHPRPRPDFLFHKVRLFIDTELNLPIRFESYGWPKEEGGSAELIEEYSYVNLRLNVGLTDLDFDVANESYSFGRF
jgi:hypothetical protein